MNVREAECVGTDAEKCHFCGENTEQAVIWWDTPHDFRMCFECVRRKAPAFLADAIPLLTLDTVTEALGEFTSRFWRAVALRVLREQDKISKK